MVFRDYNKDYSYEEEKEDNPYCLLCKLRREEDFPHLYGECEALGRSEKLSLERVKKGSSVHLLQLI